ncbi:hypothetical protein GWK47_033943 [Chionoecetes opilio]|uniref:Uncharacterized protein n=1 Tax=Chionoecetes opilio TaxID=41210 RepID=A0A8J5CPC4_CHIOP|nr:hypothetical protein GWK47_033943 [Chionoecetes opilio]
MSGILKTDTVALHLHQLSIGIRSCCASEPEGSSRIPAQRPTTPLDPPSRKNSPPQKCSPSHPPSRGSANSLSRPSPSHGKFSPSAKTSPHTRSPGPSKSPNYSMPMFELDGGHQGQGGMENQNSIRWDVSDSSSDSDSNSSSSSGSDSDSDSEPEAAKKTNGHGTVAGGHGGDNIPNGNDLINDLELSSVSEDSD